MIYGTMSLSWPNGRKCGGRLWPISEIYDQGNNFRLGDYYGSFVLSNDWNGKPIDLDQLEGLEK